MERILDREYAMPGTIAISRRIITKQFVIIGLRNEIARRILRYYYYSISRAYEVENNASAIAAVRDYTRSYAVLRIAVMQPAAY